MWHMRENKADVVGTCSVVCDSICDAMSSSNDDKFTWFDPYITKAHGSGQEDSCSCVQAAPGIPICAENATWVALRGSCQCDDGFVGDPVLGGCADKDECAEDPGRCGPGAVCTNTEGSHRCACDVGFTGTPPNCKVGSSCNTTFGRSPCGPLALCEDTDAGHMCKTISLQGCPVGCDPNSSCVEDNDKNSTWSCVCNPGYSRSSESMPCSPEH
jgi:hypothetical protein